MLAGVNYGLIGRSKSVSIAQERTLWSVSVLSLGYARPAATSSSRVRPASWIRSSWSSNQIP